MSGEDEQDHASEETLPDTSLHAYREGREEDVEGDAEKLKEGNPDEAQREEIAEGEDPESNFPEADKD
ncbi:MAG TPA: hypothetical protein VNT32_01700 [Thermoleophilaceae bacterium]|nr:hypothetical protein [Thermoleophilaceae bacterium]